MFPERNLNQTAVYWASPTQDAYGSLTWDDPEEIDCRWVESTELITLDNGEQVVSRAQVQVKQDLDRNGMLYLGELDDLDSDEEDDPREGDGAYLIRRFDKVPTMRSGRYYRVAYL